MFKKLPIIVITACMSFSVLAIDAESNVTSYSDISKNNLDADADGMISRDEAFNDKNLSKHWGMLDENNDGFLSKQEALKIDVIIPAEIARETDHPQKVDQYRKGEYISPNQQIIENSSEN